VAITVRARHLPLSETRATASDVFARACFIEKLAEHLDVRGDVFALDDTQLDFTISSECLSRQGGGDRRDRARASLLNTLTIGIRTADRLAARAGNVIVDRFPSA